MKPDLKVIEGGKPPRMKFGSFGRERDIEMFEQYVTNPKLKALWIAQTSAAHDLNDGIGTIEAFLNASRLAIFPVSQAFRDPAIKLLARIARYHPECLVIWDELAICDSWSDRFTVAGRLYWYVPSEASDRLFNVLRNDKSKRVREIAIDRYENRANEKGEVIFGRFDASQFDERVRRGEVKI